MEKLIILGSGPAGLTAALYAARGGQEPLVIAGSKPGGQLMDTTVVENYPGFPEGIDGPELMNRFIKQAEHWGARLAYKDVESVDLSSDIKRITVNGGQYYEAEAVIIATGAVPRRLHIPGEDEYYGRGVSTCATCDGAFYKDKTVAVIGGGDSAMEEANFLTNYAQKVYVIHRREELRASEVMQERAKKNEKIEFLWNSEVKEVVGKDGLVHHLRIWNNQREHEYDLEVDGMFLAIGHIPVTGFLNSLTKDEQGYILSEDGVNTNVDGVFVAGDVEDSIYRQAVTAAGSGCRAAMTAQKWLD